MCNSSNTITVWKTFDLETGKSNMSRYAAYYMPVVVLIFLSEKTFFQKYFSVLMQGAPQKVIGLEPGNICEEMQIIDGIVIQPSLSCHVEDETEPDVKME